MNLKDYKEAADNIHSLSALTLWVFYKSKYSPVTKEHLIKNISSIADDAELDKAISYLLDRGFKVQLKE